MVKKKQKLTPDEIRQKDIQNKIRRVFKNSGFVYLPTRGKYRKFGGKQLEIDSVFVFENIILFCEDTISAASNHLLKSKETAQIVEDNFGEVLEWLWELFPDRVKSSHSYSIGRYRRFFLYFSDQKLRFESERFEPLIIVKPEVLKYLDIVSSAMKKSTRFEIFRFLGLTRSDIGLSESGSRVNNIDVNIICPEERIGLENGVRAVSFMMDPGSLLECGYVLRKDNWESSTSVYQRLIEPARVRSIRQYVAQTRQSFVNNIIVSLPSNIQFKDESGMAIDLNCIQDYDKQYKLCIPLEYNSICIIDGQHRIYAYHEGMDSLEEPISNLREKLHLLVTGLVFPREMNGIARAKYQSQVFLDINSKAKGVSQEVLLFIEELKDAFSSTGIARQVLISLNEENLFDSGFQLSALDDAKIKTISIIRFALKKLVEINDASDSTLFRYWAGDKAALLNGNGDYDASDAEEALKRYVLFVATVLGQYFSALRDVKRSEWEDGESKILSVTSINGFLIALRKTLPYLEVKDFNFYRDRFSKLSISFKRSTMPGEGFPYASSQYNMMSDEIIRQCFPEAISAIAPLDNAER